MTFPIRFLILSFLIFLSVTGTGLAQDTGDKGLPSMPDALEVLVDRGAQVRFLGRRHGMDGWIAIYQGQEQYYYVTPDGSGFVTGILFDADGKMATVEQVRDLQKQGGAVLDFLAADPPEEKSLSERKAETQDLFKYKSPAERLFTEVENSNWIALGNPQAPVLYAFMDPQCPHCHDFMQDLRKDYLETGLVQLRLIPVGFRKETLAQAAFLLAAPDAEERWYKHLDGDTSALPAKENISTQGVQKNLALMQAWEFNVTPLTVYRGKDGTVKLIRGRAKNLPEIIADLPL